MNIYTVLLAESITRRPYVIKCKLNFVWRLMEIYNEDKMSASCVKQGMFGIAELYVNIAYKQRAFLVCDLEKVTR